MSESKRVLYTFTILLVLLGISSSNALNYEFNEDFSGNLLDWEFRKEIREGNTVISESVNNFKGEGYLASEGLYSGNVLNVAVHNMETTFGVWQLKINYPEIRSAKEFEWYIAFYDDYFGGIPNEATSYQASDRTRNGTMISLAPTRIEVVNISQTNTGFPNEFMLSEPIPSGEWIEYSFVKTPERFLILIDDILFANFTYSDGVPQFGNVALVANQGTQAKLDNFRVSPDYDEFILSMQRNDNDEYNGLILGYIVIFSTFTAIIALVYTFNQKIQTKKLIEIAHQSSSPIITDYISPLFNNQSKLYYALLGQTVRNEKGEQKELEDLIPQKIYQYRFLLHPYRLALMKLLDQYYKMSSVEIKEKLGLSWGEYSNIIKSLKKKEYIELSDDFEDSSVRRFVFITDTGMQDFRTLKNLLDGLLFNTENLFEDDNYDNLYPS